MFKDPEIGESVQINGKLYTFIEVPEAPGVTYAELGKKAKVYRIMQGTRAYALKVFKPAYRNPNITRNTDLISRYRDVKGLAVAERSVLAPNTHKELLGNRPEFTYAVLMPWIEGMVWGNYIVGKTPITGSESLQLAKTLTDVLCGLEEHGLAHCDLSGGNFIISLDYSRIELVDIEELYGAGLQTPDPLPTGTGGYSPEWVRKNGLWEAAGDRFAAGILVGEILGWQFEDVRNSASNGEAYFADDEFGKETKRFRLLLSRLERLHPDLAKLFETIWKARGTEECPRIAEWKKTLDQIAELSPTVSWEWESLGLPPDVVPTVQPIQLPAEGVDSTSNFSDARRSKDNDQSEKIPEFYTPSSIEQLTDPKKNAVSESGKYIKSQTDTKGIFNARDSLLIKIFMVFVALGIVMFILISIFGSVILQVASDLHKQSGLILPDAISNAVLGLSVGSVHSWIFRNNIRSSRVGFFILSSGIGGGVAGLIAGVLTNSYGLSNPFLAGAIIGCIAGALSSAGQDLFIQSRDMRAKWLLFNAISWTLIWIIGTKISWGANSALELGGAAALIIIASGAAVSFFLHYFPEIEF